jgi:hypothetical protein
MATTTNYGWTTPDDTALVKDGAAAIRTLGSSVDTTTKNLNPSTTLGDIEYRSSTANVNTRLAIGSTGNVLTVSGGVPAWVAPAGGGKVLQVIQASYSTATTIATTTYTDTGLTASITPSSTSSKILVLINQAARIERNSAESHAGVQLLRDATVVFEQSPNKNRTQYIGVTGQSYVSVGTITSFSYLDSPSTTSSTTYKIQAAVYTAAQGGTYFAQDDSSKSVITLLEIGA